MLCYVLLPGHNYVDGLSTNSRDQTPTQEKSAYITKNAGDVKYLH
jgi:hypothetical protein